MKHGARIFLLCIVAFMLVVSFKIIEPEIKENGLSHKARDDEDYLNEDKNIQNDLVENHNLHQKQNLEFKYESERNVKVPFKYTAVAEELLKKYSLDYKYHLEKSPWKIAEAWVNERTIHPEGAPELGAILREMSSRKIIAADVGHRGTQLKISLVLEGGQRVAFKPKWYDRDFVIVGLPYDGADRHNGEITSFQLNRLLGFRRSPLVVGRTVNLKTEVLPVADEKLKTTFFSRDNNTCFYGKCMYCKGPENGVCADGDMLEGAVVLWLPGNWKLEVSRHPWQRTYSEGKQARWEYDNTYCNSVIKTSPYDSGPRLLDILDASIFDYLIGNADRHHYETFKNQKNSMLVMLDSAKSFGNPYLDETSILAPVQQCCRLRKSTWNQLVLLKDGVLSRVLRELLKNDPLSPLLTKQHYEALDRRLKNIITVIESCIKNNREKTVLIND